jgi:hypothetical protein
VCSPLANTVGVLFTAARVKVRAVDLERAESMDMMGRMRKTVSSMSDPSRLVLNHFSRGISWCITCFYVTSPVTRG